MTSMVDPLQVSRFLRVYDDAALEKGIKLSMDSIFKSMSRSHGPSNKEADIPKFSATSLADQGGRGILNDRRGQG